MDFIETRKQIEIMLIKKAKTDKQFEKLLFSDPSAALKSIGVIVPEEMNLKVVKEVKDELTLVYPADIGSHELNELELINASGGSNVTGPQAAVKFDF